MEENRTPIKEIFSQPKTKILLVFLFVLLLVGGIWWYRQTQNQLMGSQPPAAIDQPVSAMTGEITKWQNNQLALKNDKDGQVYQFVLDEKIPVTRLSSYNQDFENTDLKSIVVGAKLNLIYRRENEQTKVLSAILMPEFSTIGAVTAVDGKNLTLVAGNTTWKIQTDDTTNIIGQDEHNLRAEKLSFSQLKVGNQLAISGKKISEQTITATKIEIIPNNTQEIKN